MGQKSRWVLPQTINPPRYRRFVVCVPDERFYIAAFRGLLIELTYSKNWQRDSDNSAAAVSRVWQTALESVFCDDCDINVIEEMEYQMSICEQLRFNPETGKLQGLCCGEWTDIAGQIPGEGTGGTPPGGGTPQPTPGGCTSYHMVLSAQEQWLLPTVVNAGDVISFSNPKGVAQGTPGNLWYCPNGSVFFAGLCTGVYGNDGGDPIPTEAHMAVVAQIAGVWYGSQSPITVPGGVSNAPVVFQVNDGILGDNSGGYSVDLEVCNNQAGEWTSVLNFALSTYGWVNAGANTGVWVPGSGWQVECLQQSGVVAGGASYMLADVGTVFPATAELTSVKAHYVSVTIGTMYPSTLLNEIYTNLPAHNAIITAAATVGTSDLTWNGDGPFDNIHTTLIVGYHAEPTGPTPACPGGTGYLTGATITGKGVKPTNLP